ncbi:DUF6602 domain-containing protein [Paenibacillus sp. WLX1005]|uniref:DUF6602 domain-containing protein n=1 Tax=Paenibacillus sp. WLX1005 TaxID=3243766 RepID=UPI003983DB07
MVKNKKANKVADTIQTTVKSKSKTKDKGKVKSNASAAPLATSTIRKIKENYISWERSLVEQLQMASPNHQLTTGGFREEVWMSMFKQMIPQKFSIARSVFIIDSQGRISDEVDLAIFDEQYTPYIFRQGVIKYIPIEAVAVVVQCKSESLKIKPLKKWLDSIVKLQTSLRGISRIMTGYAYNENQTYVKDSRIPHEKGLAQTSTRPIVMLCHLSQDNSSSGELYKQIQRFDFVISPNLQSKGHLRVQMPMEEQAKEYPDDIHNSILYWLRQLNQNNHKQYNEKAMPYTDKRSRTGEDAIPEPLHFTMDQYRVHTHSNPAVGQEISLLTLTFQLNQLLMLINNPLLFPHQAYVDMFNKPEFDDNIHQDDIGQPNEE